MEVPTIESRRVTQVPHELAPTVSVASSFQTCLVCQTEVAEPALLVPCDDCELELFCSEKCRLQGCAAHKSDGYCDQIAAAIQKYLSLKEKCGSHEDARREWYQSRFPDDFDGDNHDDLLRGRSSEDPFAKPHLDCLLEFCSMCAHHPNFARAAVEMGLCGFLHLRQLTYLADPYKLDVRIASVLLKLYREDDAVGLILYWLDWRSRGRDLDDLQDDRITNRKDWDWPFPIVEDARLLDITGKLCSFPEQDVGTSVPIEFVLTVLVIKVRFITVYLSRADAATLYLNATGFRQLTNEEDTQSHIISFLVAGGRERYEMQRTHANQLMDYIDERDATLLQALVDPSIQQNQGEQQVNFETFLDEYANGKPVVHTIKSILMERYRKKVPARAS